MIPDWQQLVAALRDELKEYGALRNIFDEQQKAILAREGKKVNELNGALNVQIEMTKKFRDVRVAVMRDIAHYNELPIDITLDKMKTTFPAPAQELLKALIHEIDSMILILRRRSRQNQLLLARTCEIMEQTLRLLRPEGVVKTYGKNGSIHIKVGYPVGGQIQAIG
jgi:flagellar biosynthesis/type III secretory pathway chaperone